MSWTHLLAADGGDQAQVRSRTRERSPHRAKLAFFSLLVFTVVLYARPQDLFPALQPLHLQLVVGAFAGLALLLSSLLRPTPFLWTRELKIVLALTAWFAASVVFSYWKTNSLDVLIQVWLKTLFIFLLFTETVITLDRVRKVLWVIILCGLVVASISVFRQEQAVMQEGARLMNGVVEGMLAGNYLGITAGMTFPFMAALLLARRSLLRSLLLMVTFALVMWTVVLTSSRSGLLTVLFSLTLTWALVLRGGSRSHVFAVSTALVVLGAILLAPQAFWERMVTLWDTSSNVTNRPTAFYTEQAEESKAQREQLLHDSIEYTLERPIFGWGIGNFPIVHGNRIGTPYAWLGTHNMFTQISSETGIPALLLFLGLVVVLLWNMHRVGKIRSRDLSSTELGLLARATIVSILSFMFAGFFAHLAYDYYFYYVVGIAVGLGVIAQLPEASQPIRAEEIPTRSETASFGWNP